MFDSPLNVGLSDYDANFISNWRKVFDEYKKTYDSDKVWIAGPSSYVFSLCGVKFAVDPQIRRDADFDQLKDSLVSDFSDVSFVLITHQHGDHMCVPLINALKDTDIRFYVPEGTRADYIERCALKPKNLIYIRSGDEIKEGSLLIKPFFTPHAIGEQPFLQCGFEIICQNGKIIIPGDIRDYSYAGYPDFGKVDLCISHLWAGNDSITPENYLPMLELFSKVSCSFGAERYFLCHLYEIGRQEQFLWSFKHAGIAMDMFYSLSSNSRVEVPRIGYGYDVFVK